MLTGGAPILERGNNRMRLRVTADRAGLLVLADNWFPAWRARVGDADAPVLRANHTLRAVPMPAGQHEVELFYDSRQLTWSLRLTILSLVLVSVLPGMDRIRSRHRGGDEPLPEVYE